MILKISLRAKAGVPKTVVKRKLRLHSLHFPQNTLMLTETRGNSMICILFLEFVRFAIENRFMLTCYAYISATIVTSQVQQGLSVSRVINEFPSLFFHF